MTIPPVGGRGAPPWRLLARIGTRIVAAEVRERLQRLREEPAGFVARALGERHREIREEGRSWTEADVEKFLDEDLPIALEDARREEGGDGEGG